MKPSSAMTRLMKKLSSNPRFKAAKKSGRGYVIPGAGVKPPPVGIEYLGQQHNHHHGKDDRAKSGERGEDAGAS
jgi:hypothetical protein